MAGNPPTEHIGWRGASGGTETSKYPEEQKSKEIPLVVANERGRAQTTCAEWAAVLCVRGVVSWDSPTCRKGGELQTEP